MRKRSIRTRGVRRRANDFDLDITSLLDILVILLVFLLKSYNSSGLVFNIPKDIVLPTSNSKSINTTGVLVQASNSVIWVDSEEVLDLNSKQAGRYFDQGGRRIIPLYNILTKKKREVERIAKSTPAAKKFSGQINLIVDKKLQYSFIKKLLYTCAEAGYVKYKFVVLGENN